MPDKVLAGLLASLSFLSAPAKAELLCDFPFMRDVAGIGGVYDVLLDEASMIANGLVVSPETNPALQSQASGEFDMNLEDDGTFKVSHSTQPLGNFVLSFIDQGEFSWEGDLGVLSADAEVVGEMFGCEGVGLPRWEGELTDPNGIETRIELVAPDNFSLVGHIDASMASDNLTWAMTRTFTLLPK